MDENGNPLPSGEFMDPSFWTEEQKKKWLNPGSSGSGSSSATGNVSFSGGGGPVVAPRSDEEDLLFQFLSNNLGTVQSNLTTTDAFNSLANGQIPPALLAVLTQNQDRSLANTVESYGSMGARFGTDLAKAATAEQGRLANELAALVFDQIVQAQLAKTGIAGAYMQPLLGSAQIGANREENALARLFQEFLANSQPSTGDLGLG